ncbi:sensor histidine kinase [Bacteroides helcogenes]|uniref:Signal transduction histidine kinase, LytS n=1 Tax=Bacteroides helcogenes (strain ATCC 35417 / DSM 20613 / JCM 6297 / CCUG 15421 / P 36-108) TaxID=693979 RepID=E6SWX1_BACT6|nr:histidine kinase [Bacteroides helcogenes]ADV44659.1 signal transduction histidine kinase, LytS [Bacteroides helcogenes P 36-108]MDY5238952.1 histidine kinase [Bacteroides helcogenes]
MKQIPDNKPRIIEALIHVIGWGIVFGFPFLMMSRSGFSITWMDYVRHGSVVPLSFLVVFYVNYFILIPCYLFEGHIRQYLLFNVLLIVCIAAGAHLWQEYMFQAGHTFGKGGRHQGPPKWIFFTRDLFSMVLTVGLSVAIKMSGRWIQMDAARREAEKSRTEAELKNLRSQLNPHFLLNTLNNIYALIAFNSDKAQAAVQELSRLLRHVLYDNQQNFVTLDKEMDFIRSYIELMRIRLADNVSVNTQFDVRPDSRTEIAPLIFISLIENAFKHGISPTEPSFIRIRFSESPGKVCCEITNSYHPKSQTDKSGSGIGLEQVRKRLELTYPGRYTWQQGVSKDGKEYKSILQLSV